jgi:hypothetical protein
MEETVIYEEHFDLWLPVDVSRLFESNRRAELPWRTTFGSS